MREAADAAWEQDWRRAIESYQSALEQKPGDTQAMAGLALSFLESGHTDQALLVYEQIAQRAPNDPLPHEQMAKIYAGLGRPTEAAAKYLEAAEIFATQRLSDEFRFDLTIKGRGGEAYSGRDIKPIDTDSSPPTFKVVGPKGKVVATGQFKYG